MIKLKSDKIIFVDVDNTLVMWNNKNSHYTPHEQHILMVKKFHKRGQKVIVWSAGGWEWASKIVKELQLEPHVFMVCSKPAWFIDDLPSSDFMPEMNRIYIHQEETYTDFFKANKPKKDAVKRLREKYYARKEEVLRKHTTKVK